MSEKLVEYIGVTQEALKQASAEGRARKQAEQAAQAQIPAAVQALVAQGLIPSKHAATAEAALATHEGAVGVVARLAERAVLRKHAEAPAAIGTPVAGDVSKSASADAPARRAESDADLAFVRSAMKLRNSR